LHHGTLLVQSDPEKPRNLLKEGGRSRSAPVANLGYVVPRISVGQAIKAMSGLALP
jgi:lipoate-protein ligase A